MKPLSLSRLRIPYGYWTILGGFFCVFFACGYIAYTFSFFVKPLQAHFGWARGEIMLAYMVMFLFIAAASYPAGRMIDRYGARRVIALGALITGLGMFVLYRMDSLLHLHTGYVLVGIGSTAIGPIPASAVVSSWFSRNRGTAVGIMATGIGVGGFSLAPLVGNYLIPSFGWRGAYLALAIMVCVVLIPLSLLMKRNTAILPLPDGNDGAPSLDSKDFNLRRATTTSAFWLIVVSFFFNGYTHAGIMQNQVPYLDDTGFSASITSAALGMVGLASAFGKFFFGWLSDRIKPKNACFLGLLMQAISIAILINVGRGSPAILIWMYAIFMGLGVGSWLPTMSVLVSGSFGLAAYGAIFGVANLGLYLGNATGPLTAGYMYDVSGTYRWAFLIFLGLYLISIPAILLVRKPKEGLA